MLPAALRNRQFARLWLAMSCGQFGSQLMFLALPLAAYDSTGSTRVFAAILAASTIGSLLTMLVGGALTDRFDRQRLILLSDSCMIVLMAVVGTAVVHERWLVATAGTLVLTMLASLLSAGHALRRDVMCDEHRNQANALGMFVVYITNLGTPLLGAAIYAWAGFAPIVAVNVTMFAVSFLLVLGVRDPMRAARRRAERPAGIRSAIGSTVRDVASGFGLVRSDRYQARILVGDLVGGVGNSCFIVGIVPWLVVVNGLPATWFGISIAITGAVGAVGAAVIGRLGERVPATRLVAGAAVAGGIGTLVFLDALPLPVYVAGLTLFGAAGVMVSIGEQTLMQRRFPSEFQGRVASVGQVAFQSGSLLGYGIAAALLATFGAQAAMYACVAGFLSNAAINLRALRWVDVPVRIGDGTAATERDLAASA